jgi:hypothetical protein
MAPRLAPEYLDPIAGFKVLARVGMGQERA